MWGTEAGICYTVFRVQHVSKVNLSIVYLVSEPDMQRKAYRTAPAQGQLMVEQ